MVAELPRWTLLSDPEGGELCAFVRPPERLAPYRLLEIVVDAVEPARIAAWWADRLGTSPRSSDDGSFWWLEPTAGLPVDWVFQTVPEPKRVKNRIHWDVLGEAAGLIGVRSDAAAAARRRSGLGRAGRPRGQRVLRLPAAVILG